MPESGKTTRETLDARWAGIEFALLPRTLREAINVTRSLGIPFIWIDALCIIQGDAADWGTECVTMARVYSNAVVMIAAGNGDHCDRGFITREKTTLREIIRLKMDHSLESQSAIDLVLGRRGSPLHRRGWTLQELQLSTRIIEFGDSHIVRQCRKQILVYLVLLRHQANCFDIGKMMVESYRDHLKRCFDAEAAGTNEDYGHSMEQNLNRRWRKMVELFSQRQFTNPTDKLPALSGLAATIQPYIQSDYLAGLWKNNLKADLLWFRNLEGRTHARDNHPSFSSYYAPSWSWASRNFGIGFQYGDKWEHFADGEDEMETNEAEILETHIIPQGPYLLEGCFIRLRTQISSLEDRAASGGMDLLFDDGRTVSVRLDRKTIWEERDRYKCVICKIVTHDASRMMSTAGLILRKTDGAPNEYERVGMARNIHEDFFGDIELSEIVII